MGVVLLCLFSLFGVMITSFEEENMCLCLPFACLFACVFPVNSRPLSARGTLRSMSVAFPQ